MGQEEGKADFQAKGLNQGPQSLWHRMRSTLAQFIEPIVNKQILISANRSEAARRLRDRRRDAFLAEQEQAQRVRLETPDHVLLDAMLHWHPDPKIRARNQWIVYFSGNSEQYEDLFRFALRYRDEAEANVLTFNYRGVGRSTGRPSAHGLDQDAITVIQYVLQGLKCDPTDLLVIGRSLGGGVSAKALQHFPDIAYCNERSFNNLFNTCRVFIGYGVVGHLAAWIVRFCGWDLDSYLHWDRIRHPKKWLVYHREDFTLPYDETQLHASVSEAEEHPERYEDVEITTMWAIGRDDEGRLSILGELESIEDEERLHRIIDPHNQNLHWDKCVWERHIRNVRRSLEVD